VASISAAAVISCAFLKRTAEPLLGLSVGMMLSTALLHTLPGAFDGRAAPQHLFATLLGGLLTFFFLEKAAIAARANPHRHHLAGHAGWMVLVGDSLHNFTDGIVIAAAFLANPALGVMTGLAIVAHAIPQEVSNFAVLINAGYSRKRAYACNLLCSLNGVAGGLLGYVTLGAASQLVPYVLAFSAAGFIYIALSQLMPRLQHTDTVRETLPQLGMMVLGVCGVVLVSH
jgi:zinc and cadmium transporter